MKHPSKLAWSLIFALLCASCIPAAVFAVDGTFDSATCPVTIGKCEKNTYTVSVDSAYFSDTVVTVAAIVTGNDISVLETDSSKVLYAAEATANAEGKAKFSFYTEDDSFYVAVGSEKEISFTDGGEKLSYVKVPVPTYYAVTVTNGENGTVTPAGVSYIAENTDFTVTVTPDAGYMLDTLAMNEIPVMVNTENQYTVTVTAPTAIHATFKAEEVSTPTVFLPADKAFVSSDKTEACTFAQLNEKAGYTILEYGILFGKTEAEVKGPTAEALKLPAYSSNAAGQYGILLCGDLTVFNGSFFTRGYVIYKADGTDNIITVYSDKILAVTL